MKKAVKVSDLAFKKAFKGFLNEYFCQRSLSGMNNLAEQFSGIGCRGREIAFSKKESEKFFAGDIAEVPAPLKITRQKFHFKRINESAALIVALLQMQGNLAETEFELSDFRASALLVYENEKMQIIHLHFSMPHQSEKEPEKAPVKFFKSVLHEAEEKYRLIFENAPVGILHFDKHGVVKECNKKFLQIMNTTPEKLLGLKMLELEDKQAANAIQAALSGRSGYYEGYYRSVTGNKLVPLKAQISPVFGAEAEITGGLGIYEDIAESRLAESKLHYQFQFEKIIATISSSFVNATSQTIDQVFNNALKLTAKFFNAERSYIFQINPDRKTASNTHEWEEPGVSSIMHKYQNVPLKDFEGSGGFLEQLRDYIHIPDIKNFPPQLQSARHILTAGTVKSVLVLPLIIENEIAGCFGFDCVHQARAWSFEEITLLKVVGEIFAGAFARQAAEKRRQESEEKYRFLAENVSDVIWIADLEENRFKYVSPSAEKLFGIPANEILNNPFEARLSSEAGQFFKKLIPERIASISPDKPATYVDEIMQVQKDGTIFPTEVTTTWIKDSQTGHHLVIGVTRDITLRKQAEEQRSLLEKQKLKMQKADSLSQMSETIAHLLNNQLQVIKGNLELLDLAEDSTPPAKKRLADAMRATNRAAEITSRMLAYLGQDHNSSNDILKKDNSQVKQTKEPDADEWPQTGNNQNQYGILLVEAEDLISFITAGILEHFSYKVFTAASTEEAGKILKTKCNEISLVICDLAKALAEGHKALEPIRKIDAEIPVIVTSGYDRPYALKAPTSDGKIIFLKKPFGAKSLMKAISEAVQKKSAVLREKQVRKPLKSKAKAVKNRKGQP